MSCFIIVVAAADLRHAQSSCLARVQMNRFQSGILRKKTTKRGKWIKRTTRVKRKRESEQFCNSMNLRTLDRILIHDSMNVYKSPWIRIRQIRFHHKKKTKLLFPMRAQDICFTNRFNSYGLKRFEWENARSGYTSRGLITGSNAVKTVRTDSNPWICARRNMST